MYTDDESESDREYNPTESAYQAGLEDDEDLMAFAQYDAMERIPGMTEEKWESLPEYQREELINEYNSEKEKQKELNQLRDRKKGKQSGRGGGSEDEYLDNEVYHQTKVIKKSSTSRQPKAATTYYEESEDSFIDNEEEEEEEDDEEEEEDYYGDQKKTPKVRKARKAPKKSKKSIDSMELIDMELIYLPRKRVITLLPNAFFDDIMRLSYVLHRETIGKHHVYLLRKVINVKECNQEYEVDGIISNKMLVLIYGDEEKEVDLNAISNDTLKPEDFQAFIDEREHHRKALITKSECIKRSDQIKELEIKIPTEKDLLSILSRRQLTVDVRRINTVRLQGDLRIKRDQVMTELSSLYCELSKAHSRFYTELDMRRNSLERELNDMNSRLDELAEEEGERIKILKERDVKITNIAMKHQRLNQKLMRNASKNQKENFMSRKPTMPSVSWSTGTVESVDEKEKGKETIVKGDEVKKEKKRSYVEDLHSFDLKLDEIKKEEVVQMKVPSNQRKRSGLSLSEYNERFGS